MRKLIQLFTLLSLLNSHESPAQALLPKREFRGAWIATVINLDWPSSPSVPPAGQRAELIRILDELRANGINAVMFQVRSESDAMYASTIEPWSYWLTGQQGRAPSPFYDPLEFVVSETHKRGMELHAWFNPYRASREVGNYAHAANHVTVVHPEWDIQIGTIKFLDPGLPQVREHVTRVVLDVVRRYDVDGVHFDDYFYPYPPNQISAEDNATFANYSRGFINRSDWRRDNVNLLIQAIHDSIQVVKPWVKFGMSPFGIWKSGVPSGITGLDAYNAIYCDAVAWLNRQIVDYITPQLYWPFGGGQDYAKLMPWWGTQRNGRHFYPGQAPYRVNPADGNWAANEIPRQVRANRNNADVSGSVFFRALTFRENYKGFADSLKNDLFRAPAPAPVMAWKELVPPNAPQNLRFERIAGTSSAGMFWDLPAPAADGDTASRYAVYRFEQPALDLEDADKVIALEGLRNSMPERAPSVSGLHYYVVTALDRNANESGPSNVVTILPPSVPTLASPANGASADTAQVVLRWFYPDNASSYQLQVALDPAFATQLLVHEIGISDTFKVVQGLLGQQSYYWRVRAVNPSGFSAFSETGNFATGFPTATVQVSPQNGSRDIAINPTLVWRTATGAGSYRLQVATTSLFDSTALVLDASNIIDTSYAASQLISNAFHFWRVRAENEIGIGEWTATWRFRTIDVTAVAEASAIPIKYMLYQNYPNPFNPVTTIAFDLPEPGFARLKIFDVLGREIVTIIEHDMPAGRHHVPFDGRFVGSGMYYYRLEFEGQVQTRRMLLTK